MCFIYLFIAYKPLYAQETWVKAPAQTQKMKTIWDGIVWSNGFPNHETRAIFAADFISTLDRRL